MTLSVEGETPDNNVYFSSFLDKYSVSKFESKIFIPLTFLFPAAFYLQRNVTTHLNAPFPPLPAVKMSDVIFNSVLKNKQRQFKEPFLPHILQL